MKIVEKILKKFGYVRLPDDSHIVINMSNVIKISSSNRYLKYNKMIVGRPDYEKLKYNNILLSLLQEIQDKNYVEKKVREIDNDFEELTLTLYLFDKR